MKNLIEIIIFCLIPIYSSYLVNEISKVSFQALKFKRSDRFEPIPFNNIEENNNSLKSLITIPTFVALVSPIKEAFAAEGAYGIFEGRTASMLHPLTMLTLFATSMYSGYLGLQWRRLRDIGEELKKLNNQIPKLSSGTPSFPISSSIEKLKADIMSLNTETDMLKINSLKRDIDILGGFVSLDSTYSELVATRKQLVAANLRDKHWATGSILLGVGVMVSILGATNTYLRAGKLFPGPHLFAGAAITGLWAAAAALVPEMQKGNEAARVGHIALNSINVGLFAWQVFTGFDIMVKVWEKTSFP